jgi:predicted PurR-regulated permease PerM
MPALLGIFSGLSFLVISTILAAFFVHQPQKYRAGIELLFPREHEPAVRELWRRLGDALRGWMAGTLAAMVLMGTFTALSLWAVGVDGWPVLGLLTFFGTFIPYAGAIASAIPGLAVALAQSPSHFLWALIVYVAVHHLEGYVVQPIIMRKAVELRPALLLAWQLLFVFIFGKTAILIATPFLVCLKVAVLQLWVEKKLGKGYRAHAAQ